MAGSVFSVDDCVCDSLTQDLFGNLQLVFSASSLYDGYSPEVLCGCRNGVLYDLSKLSFAYRSV